MDTWCYPSKIYYYHGDFLSTGVSYLVRKKMRSIFKLRLTLFLYADRYHAENIMVKMGQDPQLASMAQVYMNWAIPVLLPMLVSTAARKFLQAVGKMHITMYMVLVLFPLNFLVDYVVLERLDLGMQGVAIQNFCFHLTVLIIYVSFLYFGTDFKKKYWPGWTRDACGQWGTFLKLGVPGMLSVSTDWAFEVCALVTGVLGETSLAAQSIVLSVNSFLLMIP